jgi:hypothetical protein
VAFIRCTAGAAGGDEIVSQLDVFASTVQEHLAAVSGKDCVHSRRELAATPGWHIWPVVIRAARGGTTGD